MRTDPTDTGGLFVGRRPGSSPIRYRSAPEQAGSRRKRADGILASGLFGVVVALCLLCWGPIPLVALWLGSRANYLSGSVNVGIIVTFGSAALFLYGNLSAMQRVDRAWVLVRRAAGHDQRGGALPRIFGVTAVIGITVFTFWFMVIVGPNDPNL